MKELLFPDFRFKEHIAPVYGVYKVNIHMRTSSNFQEGYTPNEYLMSLASIQNVQSGETGDLDLGSELFFKPSGKLSYEPI